VDCRWSAARLPSQAHGGEIPTWNQVASASMCAAWQSFAAGRKQAARAAACWRQQSSRRRTSWREWQAGHRADWHSSDTPPKDEQWCWQSLGVAGAFSAAGLLFAEGTLLAKADAVRQEVYVWGRSQSIPGGADGDVLWPQRAKWFDGHRPGWEKLSFGPNFGAALDRQGLIFVWGEGITEATFVGPLGVNVQGDARGHSFVDVQCSATKIFVLTRHGQTFFFEGVLDELRARSICEVPSQEPLSLDGRAVPGLPQPGWWGRLRCTGGVKQMSIGLEHGAFVTSKGDLYCVGSNQWGQCGVEPPRQKGPMGALEERGHIEVTTPVRVNFPETAGPIVSVAVGGRHTIATDASGKAFAFGDDRRIQLGLGDTRTGGSDERHSYGVLHQDAMGGKQVKADMKRIKVYRYYDPHMQSSPVETLAPVAYNRPPYPPPSFITCGEDFTIAVHRDSPDWYSDDQLTNVLLCCGENGEGQCGRSLQQQQQPWTQVRLPKRSRTLALACGQAHCLALLATGELFAWGANQQGQVGNGKRAVVTRPARVVLQSSTPSSEPPRESADGRIVAPAPVVVELPGKITSISCGFRNSAVICEVPQEE